MTTEELIGQILIGIIIFLYGIVIGSFLNVCIYRIPLKESLSQERSHCMKCGYMLRWYDLVPLFSYLFLGGKCRKCKEHISMQYPIVEGLNGILYVLIFMINGWSIDSAIYCLLTSALIVLSVIDFRNGYIPNGIILFILTLGLIRLGFHLGDWVTFVVGLFVVSTIFELIYRITKAKYFTYDKVNLIRVVGLLLGWKISIVVTGCMLVILCVLLLIRKNTKIIRIKQTKSLFGLACSLGTFLVIILEKLL